MQAHATEYTSFDLLQAPATRNKRPRIGRGLAVDMRRNWCSTFWRRFWAMGVVLTGCIVIISLLLLSNKHVRARRVTESCSLASVSRRQGGVWSAGLHSSNYNQAMEARHGWPGPGRASCSQPGHKHGTVTRTADGVVTIS